MVSCNPRANGPGPAPPATRGDFVNESRRGSRYEATSSTVPAATKTTFSNAWLGTSAQSSE